MLAAPTLLLSNRQRELLVICYDVWTGAPLVPSSFQGEGQDEVL
jgi:hypothetical protein